MSTEPSPNRVTWGPTILLVIAGQHERGGVDTSTIRDGVDYYQRVVLTGEELSAGISRLEWAGLIEERDRRFFLPDSVLCAAPRTSSGRLSFRRDYWYGLLGLRP